MPSALIQVAGGPAGGDLAGTYPNPTIAANAVTSAKILDGAIVDADVAAANRDGLVAVPSLRTLGTGAQQAAPGNDPRFGGYGTSLPASPVDGQEYTLVDSTTNPAYQWRFRYNAGSSSSYKWEFVGGAPHRAATVQTNEGTSSSTYADLATVQAVTLARAGEYDVRWGCEFYSGSQTYGYQGLFVAGSFYAEVASGLAVGTPQAVIATEAMAAVGAGQELRLRYHTSGGTTGNFLARNFLITPRRVA